MVSIDSIMQKSLVTAETDETVADVVRRMRDAAVGAVVLVDGGTLAGIFTERDLLTQVIAEGREADATRVGEVATRDVETVDVSTSLRACAEKLRDRGIRHLPIVEKGRPVGILSARDFFGAIAQEFERVIEHGRYDEQLREGVDPYDHIGGGYESS